MTSVDKPPVKQPKTRSVSILIHILLRRILFMIVTYRIQVKSLNSTLGTTDQTRVTAEITNDPPLLNYSFHYNTQAKKRNEIKNRTIKLYVNVKFSLMNINYKIVTRVV